MIAIANAVLMFVFIGLAAVYYAKSAAIVQLEQKIGADAYRKCGQYRYLSLVFFVLVYVSYVTYYFFPLPLPIPQTFGVPHWTLLVVGIALLIPLGRFYAAAVKDAGEETMMPKEDNELYGGVYSKIRHPQAGALLPTGWILGLMLNSPYLVLVSCLWVPAFYLMCLAEEKDLLLRYGDIYREYMQTTGFFLPKMARS